MYRADAIPQRRFLHSLQENGQAGGIDMATTRLVSNSLLKVGDVVRVRYRDHNFFKDTDASRQRPRVLEAFGRLDHQDEDYVHVVF